MSEVKKIDVTKNLYKVTSNIIFSFVKSLFDFIAGKCRRFERSLAILDIFQVSRVVNSLQNETNLRLQKRYGQKDHFMYFFQLF